MESRKYQLQKQILEALKKNDNDLYALLKSQWAHRFGVESLEELKNLDLSEVNESLENGDDQKNEQSGDYVFDESIEISKKDDEKKEEEIINENNKVIESIEIENNESFENDSNEIIDKKSNKIKGINPVIEYKKAPEVKALIPLPPKPKYSYLKKWILRSRI